MVGRAGRPQFDTEATAVIMTRLQDKVRITLTSNYGLKCCQTDLSELYLIGRTVTFGI